MDAKLRRFYAGVCLTNMLAFTRYFFKKQFDRKFVIGRHHQIISRKLDEVIEGKVKRLIINISPRYGKTELAVKKFIAKGLAHNAKAKFIHLSYSDDLALDNSEEIKDMIQSEAYQELFPHVKIKKGTDAKKKWYTTEGGGVYATSAAGQVTGFGAGMVDEEDDVVIDGDETFNGAIIIDDPIKPEDADSEPVRERVNQRFDSTIRNRVNSRNTPIIIIMQRLHPMDLCGYLQRPEEQDEWEVISLPCLTFVEGVKQALWPFKETVQELEKQEKANKVVFDRQKQQDPSPKTGLMFPKDSLHFYSGTITDEETTYLPVDPADIGGDDFAGVVTKLLRGKVYVTDVIYNNDKGTDINRAEVVRLIKKHRIAHAGIEATGGWIESVKAVRKALDDDGVLCEVRALKPRTGKHARIYNRSSFIINHFYFRADYADDEQYTKFMKNLTSYLKIQKGVGHDDAPDVLEMAASYYERNFPNEFI